jgi:hypothetical protein
MNERHTSSHALSLAEMDQIPKPWLPAIHPIR